MSSVLTATEIQRTIAAHCRGLAIGATIHSLEYCPSTNSLALDFARDGAQHGTIVTAIRQTQGRGRLGNIWLSEVGNISFSLIIRPNIMANLAYRFTFVAAVAVMLALKKASLTPLIKWPNDILLLDSEGTKRKVCGILTETSCRGDQLNALVLGIGINVGSAPTGQCFPLAPGAIQQWVAIDSVDLMLGVIDQLAVYCDYPENDDKFNEVMMLYRTHCCTIGEITNGGVAQEIDIDGALVVKFTDGLTRKLHSAA